MDAISSLHNPRVKEAVNLRDSRERRRLKRFRIDGARELRRAIESGLELAEVFICPALCRSDDCRWVLEALTRLPVPQLQVTPAVFAKLAFGDRAEGIVALANSSERTLQDLKLSRVPLVAVLEGVEKPGNVGAVLRSADAVGLDALVIADGGTDLYNPNAIRASLGTIFTVPMCAAPAAAVRTWLTSRRVPIFAARVDAKVNYTDVDLAGPAALLLGSEATGLSGIWNSPGVTPIRLPMHGIADSLNVAAAAAVLFYEALRQRATVKRRK